jgi:putative methylase
MRLSKLKILETPNLKLEQYPVSPGAAAELLYIAGFEHTDLRGNIIDLGTGTGRLAIGAALMGSERITGVDTDRKALTLARANADTAGVEVDWIESTIDKIHGSYDTVIMNPPYGTRTIHADVKFLDTAFRLAPVIYSIHKSSTRDYLAKYVQSDHTIDIVRSMKMEIPHLFNFHSKSWKSVEVDLLRITA